MPGYEVKTKYLARTTNENVRATLVTPTSGRRIRVISIMASIVQVDDIGVEFFFGTASGITADNAICWGKIGHSTATPFVQSNLIQTWEPPFGPLGAKDEVVSTRAQNTKDYSMVIVYYEIGG